MTLSIVPSRSGADGAGAPAPSFGVVICAYSPARWTELVRAVESVAGQSRPAAQITVVIDHNDVLLARARRAFPYAHVAASDGVPGLSGARNTGLRHVDADVVAFLDDDASADPGWLDAMVRHFQDPQVIGLGGWVVPRWESAATGWLAPELYWIVGCSYRGLPAGVAEIRNPI
ncbi:MAG TPA: glycosyltransferase family 2 protein, partial [Solirubrobacteraceae bacterium]|nr:glycosyltransferase family 2 protein [Solirubrobacteraceae bacterium]